MIGFVIKMVVVFREEIITCYLITNEYELNKGLIFKFPNASANVSVRNYAILM